MNFRNYLMLFLACVGLSNCNIFSAGSGSVSGGAEFSSSQIEWMVKTLNDNPERLGKMWVETVSKGDIELIRTWLYHGLNVNAQDENGNTALIAATNFGQRSIVWYLLKEAPKIDLNLQNKNGSTALMCAADKHHDELVKWLLDQPSLKINTKNNEGETALDIASQKFNSVDNFKHSYATVVGLIKDKITNLTGAAFGAIKQNNLGALKLIVNQIGINGIVDLDDNTLLDAACSVGNREIAENLLQNAQVAEELIARSKFRFEDLGSSHPLFDVCKAYSKSKTKLCEKPTEPTGFIYAQTEHGVQHVVMPISYIDKMSQQQLLSQWFNAAINGDLKIMESLKGKVNVNAVDENGSTALVLAISRLHENIVRFLLKQPGINVNTNNNSLIIAKLRTNKGASDTALHIMAVELGNNADNWPPIIIAAYYGQENILRLLLRFPGIDVNARKFTGATALFFAIDRGYENIVELLLQAPGIDVNAHTLDGISPLMIASQKGYVNIVKLLLQVPGINFNAQDIEGNTALMYTKMDSGGHRTIELFGKSNHQAVAQLLLQIEGINKNMEPSAPKIAEPVVKTPEKDPFVISKSQPRRALTYRDIAGMPEHKASSCANPKCSKQNCSERCGGCKKVFYCSAECQKAHWVTHKTTCKAN